MKIKFKIALTAFTIHTVNELINQIFLFYTDYKTLCMLPKMKACFPLFIFLIICFAFENSFAQTELELWGNIQGIRIDGELMPVQSNLSVVKNNGSTIIYTARERQRPMFKRIGKTQIVATKIDSLYFTEKVTDRATASADVNVKVVSHSDESIDGIFFTMFLNEVDYINGSFHVDKLKTVKLSESEAKDITVKGKSFQFISPKRQLKISFTKPISLLIKGVESGDDKGWQVFVPVETGSMKEGDSAQINFVIKVNGKIDKTPVTLKLNTAETGREFDGLGGNFRLQNPKADPEVIDYCLKNLNVRWGRVEMPWRQWQPELNEDPIAEAKAGRLNQHVKESMEMAARLSKMGIPVILSAWFPPDWAVEGKVNFQPVNGVWGNPLDHSKDQQIYKSIRDYITYLRDHYGVEVKLFSFNESDLGINIRQTGEEHDELIKGLGAYFASHGLKTKMLLGDNSDATTYGFIDPALKDTASHQYIGAISFHSWRGWDEETIQKWADAATQLKKPLIVAEGSIDAQAWGYPQIFQEPMYALNEINLYVRLLFICQPKAILQWQLTSDYSLLAGGGIFGDTTHLRPTQRFWNLKQLSSTPEGLKAMKFECNGANISAAALGDNQKNIYAIHIVNNAATRPATISGIPANIKFLRIYITNQSHNMKEEKRIPVVNGTASLSLEKNSYISLFTE